MDQINQQTADAILGHQQTIGDTGTVVKVKLADGSSLHFTWAGIVHVDDTIYLITEHNGSFALQESDVQWYDIFKVDERIPELIKHWENEDEG